MTTKQLRRVFVASPFAGNRDLNDRYLKAAVRDSIYRHESPYAPHGYLPQALNDLVAEERELGMRAGQAWLTKADAFVLMLDLGISKGMLAELEIARTLGMTIEKRYLEGWSKR